jgi:hypothetical protein
MFLKWDPKLGMSTHVDGATPAFDPILRFPQAKEWHVLDELTVATEADERGLVGERRTIEGLFTCSLEMQAFPFDAQAFDIVIHLGRDRASGVDCTLANGYKLAQNTEPNMIAPQISDQYAFRPCRYNLTHTTRLESAQARSEYMLSIVAQRQFGYFLLNHYLFLFLLLVLSFAFFVIPEEDYPNRLTINLTLFLIAVAFKYSVSDGLPKIAYATAFDQYMLLCFLFLMLDPVIWSPIFVVSGGKTLAWAEKAEVEATLAILGEWNTNLLFFKVACLVIGHAYLYRSARHHVANMAATISRIGKLDDALVALLRNNGVVIRPDGTVANMQAYNRLIQG